VRHRQTKGPVTDRPLLHHRATSRLYITSHADAVIAIVRQEVCALSTSALECPSPALLAGEGKRRAGCALMRNQRAARVRVLHNSAPFIFGLGLILADQEAV